MNLARRWARWLQESGFYGLLFLLPFSNAGIEIGTSLLMLAWIFRGRVATRTADGWWARPAWRPLWLSLGAYLLIAALSIAASDRPELGARAWVGKWGEYLLLVVVVADLVGERPELARRGLALLAWSSAAVVLEGVWQEVTGRGLFRGVALSYYGRMTGPYKDPIDLATYLMVMIPIVVVGALGATGKRRWLLAVLASALFGCLIRTRTLGAWLGLGLGTVVSTLWYPSLRRYRLAAAAVGGVAAWIAWQRGVLPHALWGDIGVKDRLVMWQAALGMIWDRPLLGHGLNTFMANYLDYWVGGERMPRYAHNCYLQVAAETGLLGLLAFAAILVLLFSRIARAIPQASRRDRLTLIGLLGGLAAFAAQAAVDTNFYVLRQAMLFWGLAGFAIGVAAHAGPDAPQTEGKS